MIRGQRSRKEKMVGDQAKNILYPHQGRLGGYRRALRGREMLHTILWPQSSSEVILLLIMCYMF